MKFGNDRPISNIAEDRFGRNLLAEILAKQIKQASPEDSFVIGLIGAWGSGKTSTLNMLESHLVDETHVVVKFNPWYFSGTEQLIQIFFEELLDELNKYPDKFTKVGELLSKYSDALKPIKYIPVFGPHAEQALEAIKAAGEFITYKTKGKKGIGDVKEDIKQALIDSKKRIIVFIDDIDRLEAEEVREILRLVRLVGDFPSVTYVLAYDDEQIQKSLKSINIDSKNYLEKIVQVTCHVPKLREVELAKFLAEGIEGILKENNISYNHDELVNLFNPHIRNLFGTPRDVKRYLSGIQLSIISLHEEVNPVDIIGIEAIRILFPDAFRLMPVAFELLTDVNPSEYKMKKQVEIWNKLIEGAGEKSDSLKNLLNELFPQSERFVRNTGYGYEWLKTWEANKKIAHHKIFSIYLERSLPSGILPYKVINEIFESLSDGTKLNALLRPLSEDSFKQVCERILSFSEKFTSDMVVPAVVVFCDNIENLKEERFSEYFDHGPDIDLRRIILNLFKKSDPVKRFEQANAILESSISLSSKLKIIEVIGHMKGNGHKLVTPEEAHKLEDKIRSFISALSDQDLSKERYLLSLLFFLNNGGESTKPRLKTFFEDLDAFSKYLYRSVNLSRSQILGKAVVKTEENFSWDFMVGFVGQELITKNLSLLEKEQGRLPQNEQRAFELAKKYASGELKDRTVKIKETEDIG